MTQPINDPRFATGPDYTGTTDNGLPVRVQPSSGRRANGFDRDTRFAIPVLNELLGVHGDYLAGIIDGHILNWTDRRVSVGTDLDNATPNGASGVPGPVVTLLPGGYLGEDVLLCMNPAAPRYSRDGREWVAMGVHGTGGTAAGTAIGGLASGTTPTVVCWDKAAGAGKSVRKSVIGGAFAAAGTVGGSMTLGCYSSWLDRWFILGVGATPIVHVSDDLANTAWGTLSIPAGWTSAVLPTCVGVGSDGIAIGLFEDAGVGAVVYSPDGINLTYIALPAAAAFDVVGICFSESHQKWFALLGDCSVWSAPPGMGTWTEVGSCSRSGFTTVAAPAAGQNFIIAAGRALVAVGENDGLNVSLDGGVTWRLLVKFTDATRATAWTNLVQWQGRIVAAAATDFNASDAADANNLATIMSEVAPFAFEESGL